MPPSEEGLLPPCDMARQHAILSAVNASAPPVPLPAMRELRTDRTVIGDAFVPMERVDGEAFEYAVPDWLAADPVDGAERLCRQWFGAPTALDIMPVGTMPPGGRSVRDEAGHWLGVAREAESSPALIAALEDLVARPPRSSGPATPVYGDPRQGNCLWHGGRLTALLDWEMAQVSEPLLDLGYILVFHDQGAASLADAGFEQPGWWSPERMVAEWERGTGRTAVDVARYVVLGQAKIAAIIALGAHLFTSGKTDDKRFEAFGAVLPAYLALLKKRADAAG